MLHKKTFDFQEQMALGDKGEQDFLKYYKGAKKSPVRAHDFDFQGKKVELKTDYYKFEDTNNFFIERYSDYDKLKDGSVWQSEHCDFFVYYFIHEKIFFWFDTKTLKTFLDGYIKDKSYIIIKNRAWNALGYKIPRNICDKFVIRKDKF